jgi:hypothetical protein
MSDRRRLADMSLEERDAWTLEQQKKLIEDDHKRDKKWKLGLIEESGYLCLGDTYTEPGKAFNDTSRTKGLNFKVPGIKLGKSEDLKKYFSSEKPTCIGDPYLSAQDRKLLERQKGREVDKQNRIDTIVANAKRFGKEVDPSSVDLPDLKPWNPCGPQVEANDLYLTEFDKTTKDSVVLERLRKDKAARSKRRSKEEMESGPKNIVCNPLPKGGPGVFGTFPIPKYMVDPYREAEYIALEQRMKARKEKSNDDAPPPFKPVSILKTNIIDAVAIHPWLPASDKSDKTQAEIMKEKREAAKKEDFKKPWKPSNPLKKGIQKGYPSLPNPDSVDPKSKKKKDDDDLPSWKPSSSKSSRPTRTVATSRRNLGVFKANFFRKF